jgi:hypothetical protein
MKPVGRYITRIIINQVLIPADDQPNFTSFNIQTNVNSEHDEIYQVSPQETMTSNFDDEDCAVQQCENKGKAHGNFQVAQMFVQLFIGIHTDFFNCFHSPPFFNL